MKPRFARLRLATLVAVACTSCTAFADDPAPDQGFTLAWSAPSLNEDGSPLTDLQGYYIYVGDTPDALLPLYYTGAQNSSLVLGHGGPGLRYFAVSAVNVDGVESDMTAVVSEPVN